MEDDFSNLSKESKPASENNRSDYDVSDFPETLNENENFVREYELENDQGSLYFIQKKVGDVHCVVWDAALLLAKYLEKKCLDDGNFLNGKRVIELGSGLGCVGLVASFYGGHVVMTDLYEALNLLKLNLRKNKAIIETGKGSADVAMMDWNDDTQMEPFDVILASDCVYYEESISGFIKTLKKVSTASTEIYLSQEKRSHSEIQCRIWEKFIEGISPCFRIDVIPPREQHEDFRTPDIYLLKLRKF